MKHHRALLALSLVAFIATPLAAQQPERSGPVGELLEAVQGVEDKLVALAQAIPAEKYDWRPGEGVRSVSEVLVHVAADNWFLPIPAGVAAPAETGITNNYPTVQAFERRTMGKDQAIAEMQRSFAHLKKAIGDTDDARLDESTSVFGTPMTRRSLWLMTTTHLHEHLGQPIAYARVNGVVPPWSR